MPVGGEMCNRGSSLRANLTVSLKLNYIIVKVKVCSRPRNS